jgi:hypothetical protein
MRLRQMAPLRERRQVRALSRVAQHIEAGAQGSAGASMITVASIDYCEQCKCRTLHIPLPSGERACEHHPPGHERTAAPTPAPAAQSSQQARR